VSENKVEAGEEGEEGEDRVKEEEIVEWINCH